MNWSSPLRRQHGVVLLLLLLIVFVSGSSLLIGTLRNRQSAAIQSDAEVQRQLSLAKSALLSYAANHATLTGDSVGPGFFPCPDTNGTDNNPIPDPSCSSNLPIVGRLPEYEDVNGTRYQFNDTYSGIDEQFWYVVAPRYVYNTSSTNRRSFNRTSTAGTYEALRLKLDNIGRYVAFIIAPGEAYSTQNRTAGPNSKANYLDGLNSTATFNYFTSNTADPELFNDRIVGISLDEFMESVGTSVAYEMYKQMGIYHGGYNQYPPSSSGSNTFRGQFNLNHTWLKRNTPNNGERWSNTSTTGSSHAVWIRCADDDRGYVYFEGYNGLKWFMDADNAIFRRSEANDPCTEVVP